MKNTITLTFNDLYSIGKLDEKDVKKLIKKQRKRMIKFQAHHAYSEFIFTIFNNVAHQSEMPTFHKSSTTDLAILVKAGTKIGKLVNLAKLELDKRYEVNKNRKEQ